MHNDGRSAPALSKGRNKAIFYLQDEGRRAGGRSGANLLFNKLSGCATSHQRCAILHSHVD
jgi:hypothetical protein